MADDRPAPDLYETDFYAWAQAQAAALRAGGEGSNSVEHARVAEEIESLGNSEKNGVRSALRNIIVHLLELEASAAAQPRLHWRVEVLNFRADLDDLLTRTIRNEMEQEVESLHMKAHGLAQARLTAHEPARRIDRTLRWTLPQLLGEEDDPLSDMFPELSLDD